MGKVAKVSDKQPDSVTKKIMKIYKNYGLDINPMSDEEFARMKELYRQKKENIDEDLKKSEKFYKEYSEDII